MSNGESSGGRQPYEKPEIRPIELAVDEVMMGSCKTIGDVGACVDEFGNPLNRQPGS